MDATIISMKRSFVAPGAQASPPLENRERPEKDDLLAFEVSARAISFVAGVWAFSALPSDQRQMLISDLDNAEKALARLRQRVMQVD